MKRHAPAAGEPQLLAMSPIATSSLRDETATTATAPDAPPLQGGVASHSDVNVTVPAPPIEESAEKRRRSVPGGAGTRALRFVVPGETPPQPRSWLDQLSYTDEDAPPVSRYPDHTLQDDIDQLLQAGPRFADLIRPGRSDVPERKPEVAEQHYRGTSSGTVVRDAGESDATEPQPLSIVSSPTMAGKVVGRFDEAEIENRRRIHYRAHQPLKSLEPKVLRKLKERIEQGRTQAAMAREAGVQKPLPQSVDGAPQDADDEDSHSKRSGRRRRRRRRRRHRSKKAEPFQPTLGHVSEEQQSLSPEDDDDDDDDASSFDPDGEVGQDTLDEMEEDLEDDEHLKRRRSSSDIAVVAPPAAVTALFTPSSEVSLEERDGVPAAANGGEVALESAGFADVPGSGSPVPGKTPGVQEKRRPSFHLGWDSNRNSDANLTSMGGSTQLHRSHTNTSDVCSPDTCCTEDPATCPEPPCVPETCPDNQADAGKSESSRASRHRHHHHHHHHHHHREHFSKKDLKERCFSGAELRQLFLSQRSSSHVPTEAEEASGLKAKDLDEMNSHRLERHQVKHHRHKPSIRANHSIVSVVEVDHVAATADVDGIGDKAALAMAGSPSTGTFRTTRSVDHRPHDLFVELDELTFYQQDRMWQWNEKARWIRFEEDLVEGGERWGKAHVASLSFHSLLQMRNLLESATFIKDLDANDLPQIASAIYEQLVHTHTLSDEEAEAVRRMLLLKHLHVGHDHHSKRPASPQPNLEVADRNFTTPALTAISEDNKMTKPLSAETRRRSSLLPTGLWRLRRGSASVAAGMAARRCSLPASSATSDQKVHDGETQVTTSKSKKSILDMFKPHIGGVAELLPDDCEVVSSLVGYSPFVSQTLTVVLRLAHGVWLPTFSEVDRPTRFIFLFLVPVTGTGALDERDEYSPREIGRVFATLMADQDFHEIAYKARCREDLVGGLRDFLDQSIVLPPGEWDRATLLPVVKFQRERIAKQKRTQSMRSRHDTEPSMISGHLPGGSVGAKMTDMEAGATAYSRRESALSGGMPDNELAAAMAGAIGDGGYGLDYAPVKSKKSSGGGCRRFCQRCIPFAGLCNDLSRLRRRYPSDWIDPFRKNGGIADVIVGSLFLLFVALAPAITFGALMEQLVNPKMSLSKSLVAAGIYQLVFSLVGGQPQIVLGVTGPVFIIETTIGMMATTMNVDYLVFRFIVGVSASLFGFVFLIGNLASYLSRVPRSVEEIFNMFTAIFYIFKSVVSLARPLIHVGYLDIIAASNTTKLSVNETIAQSKAFQHFAASNGTMLVAIGTYMIVMTLAKFKQGHSFTRRVRWALGSFNVPMAILLMTIIANLVFRDYPLPSLNIPASAANPSSWISVPDLTKLNAVNVAAFCLAVLIGLCTHLLTFTETGICGLTLSKSETGMKKPTLFHLNILVVQTLLPLASGILCWPFFTGAVVRSNAHVLALQVWEDRALPGVRRRLVGIREQRISGTLIGVLVFLCVFLGPYVLRLIPMGAMYGMFFYMGVSTLRGLQLVTRTRALLQRRRYWPEASYLQAPMRVLISFTLIEWFVVAILFTLNCLTEFADLSYPSVFFPIVLVLYGFLRIAILPRLGSLRSHLKIIDKGHGVEVDPPHEPRRCCGRASGMADASDDSEAARFGSMSGKSSRRMTPVASAPGAIDGMDSGFDPKCYASEVYEKDSDDSDDTDNDLYQNTDRPF